MSLGPRTLFLRSDGHGPEGRGGEGDFLFRRSAAPDGGHLMPPAEGDQFP